MENPPGILNNTGWISLKMRAVLSSPQFLSGFQDFQSGKWETLSTEILCKTIVWCTDWEYHLFCMRTHCLIFVWKIALVHIPHFFCKVKNCPALWLACVKSCMCNDCSNLFLCDTMCFCILQMEFQGRICDTGSH